MITLNTQTNDKSYRQPVRERLTLLIVDKKQVNTVLEKNIMSFGNRVIVAECHRHAIQAATNTRNDLITINMNLPGRDTIQLISKIKEVVGAYNVVSTYSGNHVTGHKEKEKQILYYIKKPLEVNEIQSILEHISQKKIFNAPLPN
jgi:DNA-binding NtrC family response regulator